MNCNVWLLSGDLEATQSRKYRPDFQRSSKIKTLLLKSTFIHICCPPSMEQLASGGQIPSLAAQISQGIVYLVSSAYFWLEVHTPSCPALWIHCTTLVHAVDRKLPLKPSYKYIPSKTHTQSFLIGSSLRHDFILATQEFTLAQAVWEFFPSSFPFPPSPFSSASALLLSSAFSQQPRMAAGQENWQEPIRVEKICCCHRWSWTCHCKRWHCAGPVQRKKPGRQELCEAVPEVW